MGIKENLESLKNEIPEGVVLVAVSKTMPVEDILEAYHTGHRDFGENKVQDLVSKQEQLPGDIRWHMIGHLQSNKVKYLAPFVHRIHGIDSLKLLKTVEKEGDKNNRIIDCLFQIHIAEEETKFGLTQEELQEILDSGILDDLKHVRVRGVMGMATFTENKDQIRKEFRQLKRIFDEAKSTWFSNREDFNELSFGMSNDYELAIEEGSTMVRIGSLIFGPRNY